jgi:hypothetical protein
MADNKEAGGSSKDKTKPFWKLSQELEEGYLQMEDEAQGNDGGDEEMEDVEEDIEVTNEEVEGTRGADDTTATNGGAGDDTTSGGDDGSLRKKRQWKDRRPNMLAPIRTAITEVSASGHPLNPWNKFSDPQARSLVRSRYHVDPIAKQLTTDPKVKRFEEILVRDTPT